MRKLTSFSGACALIAFLCAFLYAFLIFPSLACAASLYLNSSVVSAGGTTYWGLSETDGSSENSATTVSHSRTNAIFQVRPGVSSTSTGTPGATSIGYGWATAGAFTGTISAGDWVFNIKTSDTSTTGVANAGANVFKRCGTTDTELFYVLGTVDVFAGTTQQAITSSQSDFELNGDCQIKVEYWIDVSTTGSNKASLTFYSNIAAENITFPSLYNHVYNVSMNYPDSNITIQNGTFFSINCTAITDNSTSGINITVEYNSSAINWTRITNSTPELYANFSRYINISNNTLYNITIFANKTGIFNVRCNASSATNLSVSSAEGVNVTNISLNIAPNITEIFLDDALFSPAGEIDLIAGDVRAVLCNGTVEDKDGFSEIDSVSAVLYASGNGTLPGNPPDNNTLYKNSSCSLSSGYSTTKKDFNCSFSVYYHAQNGTWTCNATANDTKSASASAIAASKVNTLIAINVSSLEISYGNLVPGESSSSSVVYSLTNLGNTKIDISLNGTNMSCASGVIIPSYQHYNVTGVDNSYAQMRALSFSSFSASDFDLEKKITADSSRATYWKVQVPIGVKGKCKGNISISAQNG